MLQLNNIILAGAALIAALLFSGCINDDSEDGFEITVGTGLPEFTVTMDDGEVVRSADLVGCVSVITFFHTSCPDCQVELPIIQSVYDRCLASDADSKTRFLCISRAESEESIAAFWAVNGLTLPYSPQSDRTVYSLFASSGIPRTYVVSPSLEIIAAFTDSNMPDADTLCDAITAAR